MIRNNNLVLYKDGFSADRYKIDPCFFSRRGRGGSLLEDGTTTALPVSPLLSSHQVQPEWNVGVSPASSSSTSTTTSRVNCSIVISSVWVLLLSPTSVVARRVVGVKHEAVTFPMASENSVPSSPLRRTYYQLRLRLLLL